MQPTDQMSTVLFSEQKVQLSEQVTFVYIKYTDRNIWVEPSCEGTCHVVVHPIQHDLWSSVPPCGDITGHFIICVPCQTEIQDLCDRQWCSNRRYEMTRLCVLLSTSHCGIKLFTNNVFYFSPWAHSLRWQPDCWALNPEVKVMCKHKYIVHDKWGIRINWCALVWPSEKEFETMWDASLVRA